MDDCGRTSAPSRPSTMRSPPSTRPSDARGRQLSAFVHERHAPCAPRSAPPGDRWHIYSGPNQPLCEERIMLFLFTGFLKPHTEQQVLALRDEFNEHLAQPFPEIALGGVLRDQDGQKIGYAAVIEAEDLTAVTTYLQRSP